MIIIIIGWLTFQEQDKSYPGKVAGEWCNKISGTKSMKFVCKIQWKDCSWNEADLSSLNSLLS